MMLSARCFWERPRRRMTVDVSFSGEGGAPGLVLRGSTGGKCGRSCLLIVRMHGADLHGLLTSTESSKPESDRSLLPTRKTSRIPLQNPEAPCWVMRFRLEKSAFRLAAEAAERASARAWKFVWFNLMFSCCFRLMSRLSSDLFCPLEFHQVQYH
jgi:hypothetical protein